MKVVSSWLSGWSGIWWNPLSHSNLVNTVAPSCWASSWSVVGSGKVSRRSLSFNFVKSTHSRTFTFGFGTATIGAHRQWVSPQGGWYPALPVSLVLLELFLSLEEVVYGTEIANGWAFCCNLTSFRLTVKIYPSTFPLFYMSTDVPVY